MKNTQNSGRYFIICGNYGHSRYERKCKHNSELNDLENTIVIASQWHSHLTEGYRL